MNRLPVPHEMSRRDLLLSSTVGALVGGAWGASLISALARTDQPTLTIMRAPALFTLLVEYGSTRILMLDGTINEHLSQSVERTTGFLRQRLDVLIAGNDILSSLPSNFLDHWRISTVFSLPGDNPGVAEPMEHHQLEVGALTVSASPIIVSEWSQVHSPAARPWYLEVRWHQVRCIIASSVSLLPRLQPSDAGEFRLTVTNGSQAIDLGAAHGDVLAAPEEAIDISPEATKEMRVVRLFRDVPQVIRFERDGVTVRNASDMG